MDEADIAAESAQFVLDREEEMVRMPAGRLGPATPLTEVIGEGIRPFHRPRQAEPSPRWVGVFLAICAVLFVPYIVQLALQLPSRQNTAHYRAAWVGLDVMELLALAATAWFAWTRSTWIAISAAMAGALLVADAWFDVVSASGMSDRVLAFVEAFVVELPMAAFCLWIARHAEVVADRATRLLLRRSSQQARLLRELGERTQAASGRPLR